MSVLVTGATGFLGSYVAARLIARGDDVIGLVRGDDPQARLDAAAGPGARALAGDLALEAPRLPREVAAVVHCAASVSFTEPLDRARAVNVGGTRRLLQAAARLPRLDRFVHVSTAYVSGHHAGDFGEGDRDLGQRFRNTYERSKLEAETHVAASGLPASIVRPSIVVGDSRTGWTRSFNVLYPPLRAFARGLMARVPADPAGIVDVVPVDHVADVIDAAMRERPRVLHAVAGDGAVTTSTLAHLAAQAFDRPPPEFVESAGEAGGGLEIYFPYLSVRARFLADGARSLGLEPPPLASYFARLLEYAEAARWGRPALRR